MNEQAHKNMNYSVFLYSPIRPDHWRDSKQEKEKQLVSLWFWQGTKFSPKHLFFSSLYLLWTICPLSDELKAGGNTRILFENIFFVQFCFAAETFVCFAACCVSDRTQANCFGFLNCFVFYIQLWFISFPFLHLTLIPKFQCNPQWQRTISLLFSFTEG